MDHLVGIVVPVFNTAKYLTDCLESIKNQTYDNFICVIVDDGSTDNSFQIAKEYENYNLSRKKFLVYSKKNKGVSSARNYALNVFESIQQKPDFICFIDSDDIVKETFVEIFVKELINHKADYAVCGYDEFDKCGVVLRNVRKTKDEELDNLQILEHYYAVKRYGYGKGKLYKTYDATYSWGLCNKCIRYNILKKYRFDEHLTNCEDMKLFLSLSGDLTKGIVISNRLYLYRLRLSSIVHSDENEMKVHLNNYIVLRDALNDNYPRTTKEILIICLCWVCYVCFYKSIMCKTKNSRYFFYELKKYMEICKKEKIERYLDSRLFRIKYGYLSNFIYHKYKILKKHIKFFLSKKKCNYFL